MELMNAPTAEDQVKLKATISIVYEVNPKNYNIGTDEETSIAEIEKVNLESDEEELFALITENDYEIEVEEHNE